MFKLPYETTPGSNYSIKDIQTALTHALINSEINLAETLSGKAIDKLYAVPPYLKTFPSFSHPICFERNNEILFAIDIRPFTRALREGGTKIIASTEYQFLIIRALLTMSWAKGSFTDFSTMGDIAPRVYIRFLSEAIIRRLGLAPTEQMTISIITGLFFFSLFEEKEGLFNQATSLKIGTRIARVTAIPLTKVLEVIDNVPRLNNISDYILALKENLNSNRLEFFNEGLLYSMVSGGWFGSNSREIVAVSLEHIPTFYAMLYMAITDRSYHSSYFSKMVESVSKSTHSKDFTNNLIGHLEAEFHV